MSSRSSKHGYEEDSRKSTYGAGNSGSSRLRMLHYSTLVLPEAGQPQKGRRKVHQPLSHHSLLHLLVVFSFAVLVLTVWRPAGRGLLQPGQRRIQQHSATAAAAAEAAAQATFPDIKLLVGVLSRPSNRTTRQAIRETWGSDLRLGRVMFVTLGPHSQQDQSALLDEALVYRDLLVVSDVLDSYHNTTYALVAFFRAAAAMGNQITHVLKTDEDCYVRAEPLLRSLLKLPTQWLYAGRMDNGSVSRDPAMRWYVPVSNYASNASIVYTWGMATILSADLVSLLAAGGVHLSMPPDNMLWMEDVAVGVMVADVAQRQNLTINYRGVINIGADRCRRRDAVTAELQDPVSEAMRCIHSRDGGCCGNLTALKPPHAYVKAS